MDQLTQYYLPWTTVTGSSKQVQYIINERMMLQTGGELEGKADGPAYLVLPTEIGQSYFIIVGIIYGVTLPTAARLAMITVTGSSK